MNSEMEKYLDDWNKINHSFIYFFKLEDLFHYVMAICMIQASWDGFLNIDYFYDTLSVFDEIQLCS
jgi:hypothetical protein